MSVIEAEYVVNHSGSVCLDMSDTIPESVTATFTGPFSYTASLLFTSFRGIVTMVIPAYAVLSTAAAAATTAAAIIPTAMRPTSTIYIPVIVQSAAATFVAGSVAVLANGTVSVYCNAAGDPVGVFANGPAVVGWPKLSVQWPL